MKGVLDFDESSDYHTWWESKRLAYNLIMIILFTFIYLVVDFKYNLYDIVYVLSFSILHLIIANVLYTFGWLSQLLIKFLTNDRYDLDSIKEYLYIIGVLFSIISTVVCGLLILRDIALHHEFVYGFVGQKTNKSLCYN